MSQDRFDIYFAGEILPDHAPDAVRRWLGAQFSVQGKALERLFSGQPVRIKQGVDMDTAGRYRAAFRKAGALLEIRPADAANSAAPAQRAAAPPSRHTAPEPALLPPRTGSLDDCAPVVEAAPPPDVSHINLDTSGNPIDDSPAPPPAQIDTSHLSAAPANAGDLSDCAVTKPAQAIPDISMLHLADD